MHEYKPHIQILLSAQGVRQNIKQWFINSNRSKHQHLILNLIRVELTPCVTCCAKICKWSVLCDDALMTLLFTSGFGAFGGAAGKTAWSQKEEVWMKRESPMRRKRESVEGKAGCTQTCRDEDEKVKDG